MERINAENIYYENQDMYVTYPELAFISPFKEIKDRYKKKEAAKIAGYVYLYCSSNSLLASMPDHIKKEELFENYWGGVEYCDPTEYINIYYKKCTTSLRNVFLAWKNKLDELHKYFNETPLDENNVDIVMKMAEKLPKLLDGYDKAEKEMLKNQVESRVFGGGEESLNDM